MNVKLVKTGSRSSWGMSLVKISTCVVQVGVVYMKESFHVFLHEQGWVYCTQMSKIDKWLLIAGNAQILDFKILFVLEGTGFRSVKLEMLEILIFLHFLQCIKVWLSATGRNAQNSDF